MKPCPNCGGKNLLHHPGSDEFHEFIMCKDCLIDVETDEPQTWIDVYADSSYFDSVTGKEIFFLECSVD